MVEKNSRIPLYKKGKAIDRHSFPMIIGNTPGSAYTLLCQKLPA